MIKKISITIAFIIALHISNAATYYVSITGANSNAGSAALPWRTVAYATSKLKSGDILRIKAGTYTENKITIPTNNITILADDANNRPTIDFNDRYDAYSRYVEAYGRSNFTWDGVNIKNAGGADKGAINLGYWYASNTGTRMKDIIIKNCDITYAYNAAIRWMHCDNILIENVYAFQCAQMNADRKNTYNHPHILLGFWSDNVIQRNCRVIQNHGEGIGPYVGCTNWIIENCEVADNYKINVYVDSEIGSCIVRNNLLYNTGYYVTGGTTDQLPSGVRIANEVSDFVGWGGISDPTKFLVQNVDVYNNIIINCNTGIEAFPYNYGPFTLTNSTISNNTIAGTINNTNGLYITVPGAKEVRNNIVYNTSGTMFGQYTIFSNNFTANPMFVNGTGFIAANYKLNETSTCIDAGTTITKVGTDFWGSTRPNGKAYDIGAQEFNVNSTAIDNVSEKPYDLFSIAQNKINNTLLIHLNSNQTNEKIVISLFDLRGRAIYQNAFTDISKIDISTANIAKGVYIIVINNAGKMTSRKIIIQ